MTHAVVIKEAKALIPGIALAAMSTMHTWNSLPTESKESLPGANAKHQNECIKLVARH